MISLSAGLLQVRYTKCRDRLSHVIGILDEESFIPLFESVEGTEQEPWPSSPPMQQMVEERFTEGAPPVLLGVGLSGNGHWSTAIDTQQQRVLKFDIACKISKVSNSLGSVYRVLADSMTATGPKGIGFVVQTAEGLEPQKTFQIDFNVAIGSLEISEEAKQIRVATISPPSSIQTHRWCYEISFSGVH